MTSNQDSWEACPQGQISRMSATLHKQRRQRQIGRWSGVGVIVMMLAVGYLMVGQMNRSGLPIANITCSEAETLFVGYHQNELDEETTQKVSHHLDNCPGCRKQYEKLLTETGEVPLELNRGMALAMLR